MNLIFKNHCFISEFEIKRSILICVFKVPPNWIFFYCKIAYRDFLIMIMQVF